MVFVIADILSAMLLRAIGQKLQMAYGLNARLLGFLKSSRDKGRLKSVVEFCVSSILFLLFSCNYLLEGKY